LALTSGILFASNLFKFACALSDHTTSNYMFRESGTGECVGRSRDLIEVNIPAFGWKGSGTKQTIS